MTFDPLKFYDDEQRKQKRYNSLLPVFLVAVVMLVAFYGFFVAYQRSHAKSVPVRQITATALATTSIGHDCVRRGNGWECGDPSNHWMNCDAGMEVTDYRDCPEFKTAYARAYTVLARKLYPQRTRKHKRKASGTLTSGFIPIASGARIPNWDTYDGGFTPSGPLAKAKYVFEDCDPVSSAQIGRYSDIIVTCSGHEIQLIWRDGPHETTPADITNLMEKIAPTSQQEIPKPDCKMPADIDVCPIQMLDKKDLSDEKGKP